MWRLNMLKYSLQLLITLTVILVVGCAGKPPTLILDDLDEERELTDAEIKENEDWMAEIKRREEILKKRAADNKVEQQELAEEKEVVEEAKVEMAELTEKVLEKRRKKLIKEDVAEIADEIKDTSSEKEIVEILEKVAEGELTTQEAKALIKEKTTLSEKSVEKLIAKTKAIQEETEELAKQLADASPEEVAEILKEAGGVSKTDILKLVVKKEQVDKMETAFLEKTMSQLYARLVRDRELGVEQAFCVDVEGMLDHLLVAPVYFDTDKHSIDDYIDHIESSFRLLEPVLEQYPDVVVQLEGNADERGTLEYNKALSDKRWVTPSKVLLALYFDEDRTQGVGRSEQCPLPRVPGSSREDWWSKNRRTDYIFKFGS